MQLFSLPAFDDNYIWLLADAQGHALVVDPGDDAPVEAALSEHGFRLTTILVTHHHHDHVGGVAALAQRHGAQVYGPDDARIGHIDHHVGDGDTVALSAPHCQFRVLGLPGHTLSHIGYVGEGILFCGDTLFSLGCGRLFEGTPSQMLDSLDHLAALPDDTRVCCAHEYTQANAAFALTVEADNPALQRRIVDIRQLRREGKPTLPVSMAQERASNPFLRVDAPQVIAWATRHGAGSGSDRVTRFAALRSAKDGFRG